MFRLLRRGQKPIKFPNIVTARRDFSRRALTYKTTFHVPFLSEPTLSITPSSLSLAIFFLIPYSLIANCATNFDAVIAGSSYIALIIFCCVGVNLPSTLLSTLLVTFCSSSKGNTTFKLLNESLPYSHIVLLFDRLNTLFANYLQIACLRY